MKPTFTISETFRVSWKCIKEHIFILAGLLIGFLIINGILSLVLAPMATSIAGQIVVTFISTAFSCFFSLGYYKNLFQALDGIEPQFSAYGQQARKIVTFFVTSLIVGIACGLGIILLIIPGIYLAIRLQFAILYIVEEDAGIIESLQKSWALTNGNMKGLTILLLVMIGITFLGMLLLIVGLFVAIPLVYLMQCYVFRKLNSPLTVLEETATGVAL